MNKLIWIFLCLSMVSACGSGSSGFGTQRGDLVAATNKSTYTTEMVNSGFMNAGLPTGFLTVTHGARTVRIVYRTADTNGNIIKVSGLLAIPIKEVAVDSPIMVYHHGTVFHNDNAPTNNIGFDFYAAYFSSRDYIVLLPDYIGYGESAALLHPYVHADSLATTTVDMLRAVKTYLQQQDITVQDKLFLAGYSEGGYAALAAHKVIEANYANEFSVTASVPGAGSYDMTTTLDSYLIEGSTVNLPGLIFAFTAYDNIYAMNRLSEFFQSSYDFLAATAFTGSTTVGKIESELTNVNIIEDLFTDTFLTAYATANGESFLKAKTAENNIYDWKPVAPIRFFHGSNDNVVSVTNSETARNAMLARDVSAGNVTLELCEEVMDAHLACVNAYTLYMLSIFDGF